MKKVIILIVLALTVFGWQNKAGSKGNEKGFNEALRINSQLDQWEKSHIFPNQVTPPSDGQNASNSQQSEKSNVEEEKITNFKRQIQAQRKKFAQEWVDKKNKESDLEVEFFVDSQGKVDYKNKKQNNQKQIDPKDLQMDPNELFEQQNAQNNEEPIQTDTDAQHDESTKGTNNEQGSAQMNEKQLENDQKEGTQL